MHRNIHWSLPAYVKRPCKHQKNKCMNTFIKHQFGGLRELMRQVRENELLYTESYPENTLQIRSLSLPEHIPEINLWLKTEAAKKFWDADNSITHLIQVYTGIVNNPNVTSFIIDLNRKPVCLIDVYAVIHDELGAHIPASRNDYGIHFLMAPVGKPIKNLSVCCMQLCFRFLFSFKDVETIYGEPDINNIKANRLVQKAGFKFLQEQVLSYKTANVYTCRRSTFSETTTYQLNK